MSQREVTSLNLSTTELLDF